MAATDTTPLRRPRTWLVPVLVVSALMSLLASLYLGGIVDPKNNLNDFPIAIVNSDEGDVLPDGQRQVAGDRIESAIVDGVDADEIDLRRVGIGQARDMLADGQIYGAVVIPSDFSKRLTILGEASVASGDVDRPVITVLTNPRAGTLGASIATTIGDTALERANEQVGQQLTQQVTDEIGPDATISGAASLALAQPIDVVVTPYDPLPDGTGLGLSAFYYSLLLLLAGFTGAMVVSALVDGFLGVTPTEFGPFFRLREHANLSRMGTLVTKWAIMAVLGLVVSGLYLAIAHALGMPTPNSLLLWMYGALAIAAVGITAVSILSVFGTAGLLINLVLFVVLGLPSAGATVPIQASPPLFGALARVEPMHQVYLAVRSILYYDARPGAGLTHGLTMTLVGLVIGVLFGALVVAYYDRKGFRRGDRSTSARPSGTAGDETESLVDDVVEGRA